MKYLSTFILLLFVCSSFWAQEKSGPKFSGLMFGDYFYNIDQRDTSKKDLNGFQFRRIYFTTDFSISENFDARFRLEADQSSGSLTSGGKVGVMVKDAYLKWKGVFSGSDMFFGISPTPAFDVSEAAWGYRSLEKTILDFNGIVSSRDLGADLKGKLTEGGMVKYWLKIGNNSGNAPESNKYKRFYGLLQFIPIANFQFTVYGDYASNPKKSDPASKQLKNNSAVVGALLLNYFEKDKYSFGVETFLKSQQNNFVKKGGSSLQSQSGLGISLFAWVAATDFIRVVGRFDNFDPNTDLDKDARNLILGAVDFRVDKNVSIMPNIETVTYQSDGANDVIGRVTFSYQF